MPSKWKCTETARRIAQFCVAMTQQRRACTWLVCGGQGETCQAHHSMSTLWTLKQSLSSFCTSSHTVHQASTIQVSTLGQVVATSGVRTCRCKLHFVKLLVWKKGALGRNTAFLLLFQHTSTNQSYTIVSIYIYRVLLTFLKTSCFACLILIL